jgi:O-antigen/teichoic acid export membrane protein
MQPYSTQLTAMERLRAIVCISVFSQFLNIILNLLLIPDKIGSVQLFGFGATGSAISLLVSISTATLLYRAYLQIQTGFKINPWIFIYLLIAISSTLIPAYFVNSLGFASVIKLTLSFVFSTLLYIGTLWVFRLIDSNDILFYSDFLKISSNIRYFKSEFNGELPK